MTKNISNMQIKLIAEKVVNLVSIGNSRKAIDVLKPVLDAKCSFLKLDLLGKEIGQAGLKQQQKFFRFFDEIIKYNAMGGFVIVGQSLIYFSKNDFEKVMKKSREYIIKGDKWYVCDTIGERSLGQSLVDYFEKTLPWLEKFLKDENKWIKRSVGVAIHFFSKRVIDEPAKTGKLLEIVEPYIEEKQIDVIKGLGWGLKTIGKYQPEILVKFLKKQLQAKKKIHKVIMRKALTYLDREKRAVIEKYYSLC